MRRNTSKSKPTTAVQYMMPRPDLVVGALADLGLSDDKIGRYFGVDAAQIAAIPHVALGCARSEKRKDRTAVELHG